MNATRLLALAALLETWGRDKRFEFDVYRNMEKFNTLEYPISLYDLTHDEAEALFVPGVGRVDIKADGSQMELEMMPCTATRRQIAERIRKFVSWKERDKE